MSNEKKAAQHGISRQVYEYRLKHWIEVEIDGEPYLVSPKHLMKLRREK